MNKRIKKNKNKQKNAFISLSIVSVLIISMITITPASADSDPELGEDYMIGIGMAQYFSWDGSPPDSWLLGGSKSAWYAAWAAYPDGGVPYGEIITDKITWHFYTFAMLLPMNGGNSETPIAGEQLVDLTLSNGEQLSVFLTDQYISQGINCIILDSPSESQFLSSALSLALNSNNMEPVSIDNSIVGSGDSEEADDYIFDGDYMEPIFNGDTQPSPGTGGSTVQGQSNMGCSSDDDFKPSYQGWTDEPGITFEGVNILTKYEKEHLPSPVISFDKKQIEGYLEFRPSPEQLSDMVDILVNEGKGSACIPQMDIYNVRLDTNPYPPELAPYHKSDCPDGMELAPRDAPGQVPEQWYVLEAHWDMVTWIGGPFTSGFPMGIKEGSGDEEIDDKPEDDDNDEDLEDKPGDNDGDEEDNQGDSDDESEEDGDLDDQGEDEPDEDPDMPFIERFFRSLENLLNGKIKLREFISSLF